MTEKTAGNNLNYVHTQDTIYIVSICAYAAEIFDFKCQKPAYDIRLRILIYSGHKYGTLALFLSLLQDKVSIEFNIRTQ